MKILLATHNAAKVERYKKLIALTELDIQACSPEELGLQIAPVEESGVTLAENAELKARAYFGKVNLPILANDTGIYVEGEGFVAAPKRIALQGKEEASLSQQEIFEAMQGFWQDIARKHGGRVDMTWIDVFVLLMPDGMKKTVESKRECILTDIVHGEVSAHMPVRSLYISKATNKPVAQHTPEDEVVELGAITNALTHILEGIA